MNRPATFNYHRAVAPMMWVLVSLAVIELIVVHLLVSVLWSRMAALLLSVVTLGGVGWLVRVIGSMKRLPVQLDAETLVMRVGTLRRVDVPTGNVAGLRPSWDSLALTEPGVVKLSLIAYPNVLVDLREPLPGRRPVRAIAHRLDDPAAFAQALQGLVGTR